MNIEFSAPRNKMVSGSLQVGIWQQLLDPRNLRKKIEEFRGMQKRNKLRTTFSEVYSRAKIELPHVIIIMPDPICFAQGKHFANDAVEQLCRKQVVEN
jgi:hypothetical protein